MKHARLDLARRAELLPELGGQIAVFGQIESERLFGLASKSLQCVSHSYLMSKRLEQIGISVARDLDKATDHAIVFVPRSKLEAWHLIASALDAAPKGWIVVDGQKTDGIDSIAKEISRTVAHAGSYSKGHGKTIWFKAEDAVNLHLELAQASENKGGFLTVAGVFSADDNDPASELLIECLPDNLTGHFGDLGAGWGYLAARLLAKNPLVSAIDLVEDNGVALDCARQNVPDSRAVFHWADALSWTPAKHLDGVVMNPPFHQGRNADPELGKDFIKAAARALYPGGKLYMVANAHLPYEPVLEQSFARCDLLLRSNKFKVFCATRGRDKVV